MYPLLFSYLNDEGEIDAEDTDKILTKIRAFLEMPVMHFTQNMHVTLIGSHNYHGLIYITTSQVK